MTAGRYVLVYDDKASSITVDLFGKFVKNNKHVLQWASVFGGVYLIKSNSTMDELVDSFGDIIRPNDYIIVKIDSTANDKWNGFLNKKIWEWFSLENEDDSEVLKLS